jgi:N-carbamoylputrescine amidase
MAFKVAAINARTGRDQRAIAHEYVATAARQDCQLVCFPEGFLCRMPQGQPVFCTLDSPPVQDLALAARQHHMAILAGLWERSTDDRYSSALYIDRDGQASIIHRKLVPTRHEQAKGVHPGRGLRVHRMDLCTIGASLCLENWLPEIPRALALAGAELIYAPSSLGLAVKGRFDYYEMWKQMLCVRAAENVCYVVACTNAIAQRPLALVADPDGRVVVERELPGMATALVDPTYVRARRAGRHARGIVPPLRLRHLDPFLLVTGQP